jgi:hypothetical protein
LRRFYLNRLIDESGISGTGKVAYGIEFTDGSVIMSWNTDTISVAIYRNIADVEKIHGHGGKTVVEWAQDENFEVDPDFVRGSEALDYLAC